jgi:hypothetical protein
MLNNLSLIIVMILSLFLAFYCVNSHKDNIVKIAKIDKENRDKNLSNQDVNVIEVSEKVYVEALVTEDNIDTNESNKIEEKTENQAIIEPLIDEKVIIKEKEETAKSIKVDTSTVIEKVEPKEPIVEKKVVEEKVVSENSTGYELDELEKMIMEELKKGNKD